MSSAIVEDILQQIDRLPDEDWLQLTMRLAEREEKEWQAEADDARRVAREKGITQAVIDKAIDCVRYAK
jgi:uncharacterized circularly permuted ATP-grasp superfamily protein